MSSEAGGQKRSRLLTCGSGGHLTGVAVGPTGSPMPRLSLTPRVWMAPQHPGHVRLCLV